LDHKKDSIGKTENLDSLKNFQFIEPGVLMDGDLELKVKELCPYNPNKGYVPEYKFEMVHTETKAVMGEIRVRVGLTEKLKEFGGHVGYEVSEGYRGHKYAARSFKLLLPLLRKLGINPVVITCYPENTASVKTIESVGARLVAAKEVEIEPHLYRLTNIYHLYFYSG
jgi:predicted acetyltransferase